MSYNNNKHAASLVIWTAAAAFATVAVIGGYAYYKVKPLIEKRNNELLCDAFRTTVAGARAEQEAWRNADFGAQETTITTPQGIACKITR